MNPQMNMVAMGPVGGHLGGPHGTNNGIGAVSRMPSAEEAKDPKPELDTYIYDYFIKSEQYEVARAMKNSGMRLNLAKDVKNGSRREVNGVDDSLDAESKDDLKNCPDDLPPADIRGGGMSAPFLQEWWSIFWDICQAQRNRGTNGAATQYLAHTQQRARAQQIDRDQMLRQMAPGILNQQYRNMMVGMQANGMGMPNDLQKRAMANSARNPGQPMPNMRSFSQQPNQLMQTQMQRNGSGMDIDGQQRPPSPSSVDNAPSPKRARLEGQMNGVQMGPASRAQMGMQNQFANFQNQGPEVRNKSMQIYSRQMAASAESAMNNQSILKATPNGAGMPQGAGMMPQGADGQVLNEYYAGAGNPAAMRGVIPPNGQGGNHALQDYQMQLMLLEQQNKKRLMMARQEQDSLRDDGPPGPGGPPGGAQPPYAPVMSPQGSRAGPSPGPNEQMKRGTPKMGQNGLPPSPLPDGSMAQGRGSPGPMNFDAGQMPPNMQAQFYPNMGQMSDAMGGVPNGSMMRPPPSSHPNYPGQMSQQQLEAMSRQQNGVRLAGNWAPNQGPGQVMQHGPPQQQPQGTPQQRTMPPPQAPAAVTNGRQPSSPQQPPAPPTPSQTNKAAPKPKKDTKVNKKQTKKGSTTTGATPSSEAEPPATPTPATPITPMHPQSFNNPNNSSGQKNGLAQPNSTSNAISASAPAPAPAPAPVPPVAVPPSDTSQMNQHPFGSLDGDPNYMDFDADVLESFDFDQFLNTESGGGDFAFDPSMGMTFNHDGVEAGSGDV